MRCPFYKNEIQKLSTEMPLKFAQVYSHILKSLFCSINVMDLGFFSQILLLLLLATQGQVKHFTSHDISLFFLFFPFLNEMFTFFAAITQLARLDVILPNAQCITQILQNNTISYSYSAMFFTFKSTTKHLFASP